MSHKTIGILGGMGPLATVDLYRKIVLLTKADCDNAHLRVYIDGNAQIPDRTAAILSGGADPVPEMLSALRHLEACGADCIIMPCNTAHYFLPRLQRETAIPFISMPAETARACARQYPGKTACILATRGTLASGLYNAALESEGVSYLLPEYGVINEKEDFADTVNMAVLVRAERADDLKKKLTDVSGGQLQLLEDTDLWANFADKL